MAINPLWWLHARVSGSPRSNLLIALGYIGVVIVFATISGRMVEPDPSAPPGTPPDYGTYHAIWLCIITAAQMVFALILIPSSIKKAVQRDYQTGMAESHRLTPLSSMAIVRGYLVGPALQPLMMFAAGLLMGSYFSAQSVATFKLGVKLTTQLVLGGWVAINGLVIVLAIMVASIALLSAIAAREGKFNILGLLIAGSFVGGWVAVMFVPGLALVTGAMSGSLIMSILGRNTAMGDQTTVVSTAALQLVLAATFLLAAAYKFRNPDRPVFAMPLSIALAIIWGLALVLGVVHSSPSGFTEMGFADIHQVHLAFSLFAFMVVALFALHAAAAGRLRLDRVALFTKQPVGRGRFGRSAMPVIVTAMALLVVQLMALAMHVKQDELSDQLLAQLSDVRVWVAIAAAVLLSCWSDYFLFYWAAANRIKMWLILLISWGMMKTLPLVIDGVLVEFNDEFYDQPWEWYGAITSISPLGTVLLTRDLSWAIVGGLGVQLVVALLLGWVSTRTHRNLADRLTTYAAAAPPAAAGAFVTDESHEPGSSG